MTKRTIVVAALCLYATLLAVVWHVCTSRARAMTEALLDYAVSDIRLTMDGAIDTMLEHVAVTCARRFGRADRHTREEVDSVAHLFDIDELCIVDRAGIVIASNDPDSLGVDMNRKEATRPFSALTNGTTKVVTQPFRSHAYSKSRRKYLGVPFPGGDGYVQVGMDEARMPKMINTQLSFLFDADMGDTVCYLCADIETGSLVSTYLEGGEPLTLEEIGFDASDVSDPNVTFEQTLFGDKAFCRSYVFGGHRFIMVVPSAEFYGTRDVLMVVMTILLALVLGAFVVLLLRISNDARRIKAFYAAEDAARAKDMAMATNIQVNSIPRAFPPFVNERRMDIFATMHTARNVGGDFYDFFFTAPSKVAFLVADVSGKGVPAALFMMRAKATIKGETRSGLPLNEVMARVNDALSRDNDANMFVTAWMGIIDLETGEVAFVNAGHNPPIFLERPGNGEHKFLRERSGMVLGAMPGLKYRLHNVHLSPGDMLYLYTDGITEQPNGKGELFGEDRLLFAIETMLSAGVCAIDGAKSPLLSAIFDNVIAHGSDVEQADDCTQLVIRYNGAGEKRRFTVAQSGIAEASAWLDEWIEKAEVDGQSAALHIILDEICSNIVKHSGASYFELGLSRLLEPSGVKMEFIDDGVAYNPLSHEDPDTTLPASKRPIGGLGIMMVKKMSRSMEYERLHDCNMLTIVK